VIRSTTITRSDGTRRHCLIASMLILHASAMAGRSFFSAMNRITASRFDDLDIRVFHRLLLHAVDIVALCENHSSRIKKSS
jgi:hypothetical protein